MTAAKGPAMRPFNRRRHPPIRGGGRDYACPVAELRRRRMRRALVVACWTAAALAVLSAAALGAVMR
jgi:hypothetical protein